MNELPNYYLTPSRFMAELQRQSMIKSAEYMMSRTPQPEYVSSDYPETMESFVNAKTLMRERAANDTCVDGFVAEYGVDKGHSFIQLCGLFEDDTVYGFDSFEGLEDNGKWKGNITHQDTFRNGGKILFDVPSNGEIVPGWFDDTLPTQGYDKLRAKFINIDCDNCDASMLVMEHVRPYLVPGSVVVLDDYFCQFNFEINSQFSAWKTFTEKHGISYDYIYCCAPAVTVIITDVKDS